MTKVEEGRITDGWVTEQKFAEANGLKIRTVQRYRAGKDGLPFAYFCGRVHIHVETAREWLMKRMIRPNPTRKTRAAR